LADAKVLGILVSTTAKTFLAQPTKILSGFFLDKWR
jgi:hypothetical protein